MSWGVTPVMSEEYNAIDIVFYEALKAAKKLFSLKSGDNVVITGGQINGAPGNTNMIRVDTVR
jgi:pyruvate kinase